MSVAKQPVGSIDSFTVIPRVSNLPNNKTDHEDLVMREYIKWMHSLGEDLSLLGSPEKDVALQEQFPGLTTDGLLLGQGMAHYSVDVMSLPLPGEWMSITSCLYEVIENCQAKNPRLSIRLVASPKDLATAKALASIIRQLSSTNSSAQLRLTITHDYSQELATIELIRSEVGETREKNVYLVVDLPSISPSLAQMLADTICRSLTKKILKQTKRAKGLGLSTLIILDQNGHERIGPGSSWMIRDSSTYIDGIRIALARIDHAGILDRLIFRDSVGTFHEILT